NLRFISDARKEPNASAVSSGTVIIDRSRLAVLVRPLRDVTKPENLRLYCTYSLTREGPEMPVTNVTGWKKFVRIWKGVGRTPRKFATGDRLSEPAGSGLAAQSGAAQRQQAVEPSSVPFVALCGVRGSSDLRIRVTGAPQHQSQLPLLYSEHRRCNAD